MIRILWYEIINGSKSAKILFNKIVNDENELEDLREYLEKENNCWIDIKTIIGTERKKVKDIVFTFETK